MKKTLLTILFFLFFLPGIAQAIDKPTFQITIPKLNLTDAVACPDDAKVICTPWIGEYLAGVYNYILGIGGILAAIVIMWGGVIWLTAGGNQQRIGEAKKYITGSITGLVLLITSYTVLYFINPDLTVFKPIRLTQIEEEKVLEETYSSSAKTDPYAQYKNCTWETMETNAKKLGKDDLCTAPKPAGKECYCNIEALPGCSYKKTPCGAKETYQPGTTNAYNAKCGTTDKYLALYCCCPKEGECTSCVYLSGSGISTYNKTCVGGTSNCQVNSTLLEKLKMVKAKYPWLVTEAWPPTINHLDSCHKIGTCVDVDISGSQTCEQVNNLISAFKAAGLKVVNEYKGCGGTTYKTTTGGHLHIEL